MKVLVIHGSMRKNGNTSILADEFLRGAKDAGHEVEKVELRDKKFGDCFGCQACLKNGGSCVQKDDVAEILEKMKAADVIVLASPMYYFTWTGLMKRFLDRTYPVMPVLKNKKFYLITLGGVSDKKFMAHILTAFYLYVECFEEFNKVGCKACGSVIGSGVIKPGAVKETPTMQEAYETGNNL